MMITEYIPKGNLSDVLHGDNIHIPLDTRLRIAIECAEALGYMHSQMYTQVIHGDIKPANILLDNELRAKISDFGISRLVNTENTLYTSNVIGSIGYMDPMFACTGRLTAKSDVYSFGVVLLELVTRKKARNDGEIDLLENFNKALAKGIKRVREMIDSEIAIPSNMKTIEQIAQLAGKCLVFELDKRPEMLEIAEHLRGLRKALHRKQEKRALFSWGKKNKLGPADTPSQENNSSIHIVGIEATAFSIKTTAETPESDESSQPKRLTFIVQPTITSWFDLEDLLRGSAEVLGTGIVGTSYKATLKSGVELVVKRLKAVDLSVEEFRLRVEMIGAIQNEHIAQLRCYYNSKYEKLLVYNIFPKGSLARALHGDRGSGPAPLDWEQRAAIALAAARGVAYIHSAGPSSCHGNIKSSNVILIGTHDACVSEHGLITLGRFSNASAYRAPEVTDDRPVSQEADVYSFGVLLLELFTRKAPVASTQHEEGVDLPQWVQSVVREEWTMKVFDMGLLGPELKVGQEECIVALLHVAMACCSHVHAECRPPMSGVVKMIEEIRQSELLAENLTGTSL